MIYLDNAATTLQKPAAVENAVLEAFHTMGNAGRGIHGATLTSSRKIYQAREVLAELFSIENPTQIAFTANGTEALNTAIMGLFQKGDHVITTVSEHNSVLRPLYQKEKEGISISFLPVDAYGQLCYEKLEELVTNKTRGIVITHASNVTGNVTNLDIISCFAKKHKLFLILDAAQTAGSIPIDVKKYEIDVLCFTGHKGLFGPQGTGGIYVKEGVLVNPLKTGGSGMQSYLKEHPLSMPEHLEAGTLNGHGIAGLMAGVEFILQTGVDSINKKEMRLMHQFLAGIESLENLILLGDYNTENRVGIVTFSIKGKDAGMISDLLYEEYGIAVRAGAHCAPLIHEALLSKEEGALRFSFSYFNTMEEVDKAIEAVKDIAKRIEIG